jgi:hypothetical protein
MPPRTLLPEIHGPRISPASDSCPLDLSCLDSSPPDCTTVPVFISLWQVMAVDGSGVMTLQMGRLKITATKDEVEVR